MQWLRRSFIAGFFVVVPLFISVAAIIWVFGVVDGLTTPLYDRILGHRIPGLGTITTAVALVLVGALARNVIGRRVLTRGEGWLLRVPVFRTIYAPVKQLIAAFSPENESGFKRVVMVEDARHHGRAAMHVKIDRAFQQFLHFGGALRVLQRFGSWGEVGEILAGHESPRSLKAAF